MALRFTHVSILRSLTVAWSILWLLVVPLVHAHPQTDDRHGNAAHVHGATIHSVLSPDFEGEHETHPRDFADSDETHSQLSVTDHPAHPFSQPEIAFTLLTASDDRPVLTSGVVVADTPAIAPSLDRQFAFVHGLRFRSVISPTVLFLSAALPLRAPPFVSN